MVSASIEQLLILQDRDARCEHIKKQLSQIPLERAEVERQIEKERKRVADAEAAVTALLAQSQRLEGDVEEAGGRIVKYKTQQMLVKKNEEYQALEHEIASLNERVSELEDSQLEVLEEIDQKRVELEAAREDAARQIALFEARLRTLAEAEDDNRAQLDEAAEAVDSARGKTEADILKTYDFVKTQVRRPPYISPIEDGKCMGCRLRVSGDVDTQARRTDTLARCDSCGRIVYRER